MSRSADAISTIKSLTLVALIIVVYRSDLPSWLSALSDPRYATAFVGGLTLFCFGLWSKRKIIATYAELSHGNLGWGLIVLAFSAASYIYGSYYSDEAWFHYESLVLLIMSYLVIRFDPRVVQKQVPLFAILGGSLVPSLLVDRVGYHLAGAIVAVAMLALFGAYVLRRVRYLVIPAMVTAIEVALWYFSHSTLLILLVPLPIALLASNWMRSEIAPFERSLERECPEHVEGRHIGFCLACGKKYRSAGFESSNLYGLIVLVAIMLVLILAEVPALTLAGKTSYLTTYTYAGAPEDVIPRAPNGWLTNSSSMLKTSGDTYSLQQVYVPSHQSRSRRSSAGT